MAGVCWPSTYFETRNCPSILSGTQGDSVRRTGSVLSRVHGVLLCSSHRTPRLSMGYMKDWDGANCGCGATRKEKDEQRNSSGPIVALRIP